MQKAINKRKAVLTHRSGPVGRHDGSLLPIGPEMAVPVILNDNVLAVVGITAPPEGRFSRRDLHMLKDLAQIMGQAIHREKRNWETHR
jgi:GAF domain-containing protein